MLKPTDKDFIETKEIMLGKKVMNPEFKALANWIDKTYGVKTINVIYDITDKRQLPRLEICVEDEEEMSVFIDKRTDNFNKQKQKAIGEKFKETIDKQGNLNYFMKSSSNRHLLDEIMVVFGAFKPIAMIEANRSIPTDKIVELKKLLNNKDLWEISRSYSATTFFLYTDELVRKYENSNIRKNWTSMYFELLQEFDEFGYFKQDSFAIYLDSKENFDNNYESNWHYYYK